MVHKNPRKYRGPETWALVRDAYLAGEPAKLLCARFDVSYANLRAKALREGWTRRAYAAAVDLPGVRRAAPKGAAPADIPLTEASQPGIFEPPPKPSPTAGPRTPTPS